MTDQTTGTAAPMDEIVAREKKIFDSLPAGASKIVEELQREMIRANRYARPLAFVICGADCAEKGRAAAETRRTQLLRRIQGRAGAVLRQTDHFGRLDEGAILVVLPETDAVGAEIVAQRLLAGGNTPHLIAQAKKALSRVYVGWREIDDDDCDVAALLENARQNAFDFDAFTDRPVVVAQM